MVEQPDTVIPDFTGMTPTSSLRTSAIAPTSPSTSTSEAPTRQSYRPPRPIAMPLNIITFARSPTPSSGTSTAA
eukprot:5687382-Pleurochrysis_carterae.AAC.1